MASHGEDPSQRKKWQLWTPSTATPGDAADPSPGNLLVAARADHRHAVAALPSFAAPVSLAPGNANAAGAATTLVRSDHVHGMLPWGAATDMNTVGTGNNGGLVNKFSRSDHIHALGSGVVGTVQLQDSIVTTAKIASGALSQMATANGPTSGDQSTTAVATYVPIAGCSITLTLQASSIVLLLAKGMITHSVASGRTVLEICDGGGTTRAVTPYVGNPTAGQAMAHVISVAIPSIGAGSQTFILRMYNVDAGTMTAVFGSSQIWAVELKR